MSSFNVVGWLALSIVNVAVSVVTILINIFFICCMFSSQEGPGNQQKPPLNVLLGSLIGCNIFLSICIIFFCQQVFHVPYGQDNVLHGAIFYALRSSFTASVGLNVFYYFQIVPARQPFLIWVKTNIKLLIYLFLFFGNIFIISGLLWIFFTLVHFNSSRASLNVSSAFLNSSSASSNSSSDFITYQLTDVGYYLIMTDLLFRCIFFLVGLGIMGASNTSTVLYLWRHVRRMEDSSFFSALHYQNQKRVAILSIIQTVLFFIYAAGLLIYQVQFFFFNYDFDSYFSVLAFYCFGTSIILGVGQTKFRLCAVEIWKKICQAVSHLI
nr:taste receptor type 2 member 7-like [Misgurnus anguillicaudatus]